MTPKNIYAVIKNEWKASSKLKLLKFSGVQHICEMSRIAFLDNWIKWDKRNRAGVAVKLDCILSSLSQPRNEFQSRFLIKNVFGNTDVIKSFCPKQSKSSAPFITCDVAAQTEVNVGDRVQFSIASCKAWFLELFIRRKRPEKQTITEWVMEIKNFAHITGN